MKNIVFCILLFITFTTNLYASQKLPFEGNWEECFRWQGSKICTGYKLIQRNNNICGTWEYWATNRFYSGQLIARATGTFAEWISVCGDEGSTTRTMCPSTEFSVKSERLPDKPAEGWESSEGKFLICGGRLYDFVHGTSSIKTCSDINRHNTGIKRKPLSKKDKAELLSEQWIQDCLESANKAVMPGAIKTKCTGEVCP